MNTKQTKQPKTETDWRAIIFFLSLIIFLFLFVVWAGCNSQNPLRKVHSGELELHCAPDGEWDRIKVPASSPTGFYAIIPTYKKRWWFGTISKNCITKIPKQEKIK